MTGRDVDQWNRALPASGHPSTDRPGTEPVAAGVMPGGHLFHLSHRFDPSTRGVAFRWECSCSVQTGGLDSPQPAGPWHPAARATDVFDAVANGYIADHLGPLVAEALGRT